MKYYELRKGIDVEHVVLPNEKWLPLAVYICFHPDWYGTVECEAFVLSLTGGDGGNWNLSALPQPTYDACVEISQSKYRELTGSIDKADFYHRNNEPYYEGNDWGELGEDWYSEAQKILLPDFSDHFGQEDDWSKLVDGQIDSEDMFCMLIANMQDIDPELQLEAYDRWIYAHAIIEKKNKEERV